MVAAARVALSIEFPNIDLSDDIAASDVVSPALSRLSLGVALRVVLLVAVLDVLVSPVDRRRAAGALTQV